MFDSIWQGLAGQNVSGIANVAANMFASRLTAQNAERQANSYADSAALDLAGFQDKVKLIGAQTMDQVGQRAVQSMREMGKVNALLADSGLVGQTHEALRSELLQDQALDTAAIQQNGRTQVRAAAREIQGTGMYYKNRIASIAQPAGWGTVFSNAGGLFGGTKGQMKVGDLAEMSARRT